MTRPGWFAHVLSTITLSLAAIPAVAWAHHPVARADSSADRTGNLVWLLGVGVFIVVFVATWALFSYIERRQRLSSGE